MAAGKEKPVTRTKDELIAAIEQSRRSMSVDLSALGHALNPIERVKRSLARHPLLWLGGSAAAGLAGTRMLAASRRRPRQREDSRSLKFSLAPLLLFLMKSAITSVSPAAAKAVRKQFSKLLE